uniref:Vacuolar import/degradation Vid27 C-terminal domain-containing protein n=1 Tax=Haptolina ericina TaxID=156174 RepID=A0A7S3ARA3_9EUKA|mmetsp:Transcript_31831/g.71885  ORF Transcript_31831/g.71885 Transcript_31831/m.71885 type:complete len:415 (+) Transcript_31831:28-1272(+)
MASTPQILDAGPRGGANTDIMSALSTGAKKKLCFFKGDEGGTPIGAHTVFDFTGEAQSVGMVQTWNQCNEMLLTSSDKRTAVLLMDTETGATKSELSIRRQQKNWNLSIDSIAPMQKFEQYKSSQQYELFGLGDNGKTVFAMNHDSRAGQNVEEFVIRADSHRKYKSGWCFTCHAQTKAGYLALGRDDGAVSLYDAIMKSENASCVLDGCPGPVTSIDVSADGSMIVWTTPEFVFFTSPARDNWEKVQRCQLSAYPLPTCAAPSPVVLTACGPQRVRQLHPFGRQGKRAEKPKILQLSVRPDDRGKLSLVEQEGDETGEPSAPSWTPVKFDATTHKDEDGLIEREIIAYSGSAQVRWNVRQARAAWAALEDDGSAGTLHGVVTTVSGPVFRHMTVKEDMDVVALEGEIVKSLRF